MKTSFLVAVLVMAATPVFGYPPFSDFLKKIMDEPKAEAEYPYQHMSYKGPIQLFGDDDTSDLDKEIDEFLKLLEGLQKSETMWDRLLSKDEKPQSLLDPLFSIKDENSESMLDTLGKSMDVPKKYFTSDFFDKKK